MGMSNEPEPKSTGQGSNPSFSAEDQLNAFIKKLPPPKDPMITIPDFLFRDERSRSFEPHFNPAAYTPSDLFVLGRASVDKQLAHIDKDLLLQHAETYRRGLEARDQLLARIRPVEILEMVRDVWGKGEIVKKELGATLTYSYLAVRKYFAYTAGGWYGISSGPGSAGLGPSSYNWRLGSSSETDKWIAKSDSVSEKIHINFGNAEYPSIPSSDDFNIYHSKLDEFFADSYKGVKQNSSFSIGDALFREIPKTIWRRPDNLGITVTVPRASPISDEEWKPENEYRRILSCYAWFDQSASQQEIMDFFAQKLEAQRVAGFLPSQLEALELAKIEELRKRGLFIEPGR